MYGRVKVNTLPGYENVLDIYEVDKYGNVYGNNGIELVKSLNTSNYLQVALKIQGERRYKKSFVHRLVALAFVDGYSSINNEVDHDDTNKLMKKLPNYNTDFESQMEESERTKNYQFPQTAIMHDKFFIFDNKSVFTGSTNISNTCLTGFNSNVAVLINDKRIAKVYKQEFEQMFAGKFHNQKSAVSNNENIKVGKMIVSVYFSPINKTITTQVIPLIQEAKEYIYVPAFYLTRRDIIDELINTKKRGVDVKIIVDETSVKGRYVNVNYIKEKGVELKIEHWQGKMHMKSMIIDDKNLVIGSMNFTKQGETVNDENCLIIKNAPNLTSAYKAHFLELWESIK